MAFSQRTIWLSDTYSPVEYLRFRQPNAFFIHFRLTRSARVPRQSWKTCWRHITSRKRRGCSCLPTFDWQRPSQTTTRGWNVSKQDFTHSQSSSTPTSWRRMSRACSTQVKLWKLHPTKRHLINEYLLVWYSSHGHDTSKNFDWIKVDVN